ncbi:MAG: hypothetical protein LH473_01845 [Chitinophagales bacterium]|nr:hypothetical protein [Chitinophagales bacterium]
MVIALVFQFNGLYGQDAHEYLHMSRELTNYFLTGNKFSSAWFPVLYPFAAFKLNLLLNNEMVALQSVSIISLVFAFYFLKKLLRLFYEESERLISVYLLLFFAFSPYVFRFGLLSMSDMLCLWFVIAAFYYSLTLKNKFSFTTLVAASLFCGAALSTRYIAIVLVIFPLSIISYSIILKGIKYWWLLIVAHAMLLMPLLPDYFITGRILFFSINHWAINFNYGSDAYQWQLANFIKTNFTSADGEQHYVLPNILFILTNLFHPAYLFAGIIFILFIQKKDFERTEIKMLIAAVAVYAFYLAGLSYQNMRYLLLTFPFIIIMLFPAFVRGYNFLLQRNFSFKVLIATVIVVQVFLFAFSFKSIYELNIFEKNIAATLKEYPGNTIYTTSITGALHSYQVQDSIVDLYNLPLQNISLPALLVFNEPEFSDHFKKLKPDDQF